MVELRTRKREMRGDGRNDNGKLGCKRISCGSQCTIPDIISNNSSFRLKHQGVLDGSDGSDGTLTPLTENQTQPFAYLPCGGYYTMPLILATRRVVYYARRSGFRLPLLCTWNVVMYTHHQNDTYVALFAEIAVML
jgi:hypothetical protein